MPIEIIERDWVEVPMEPDADIDEEWEDEDMDMEPDDDWDGGVPDGVRVGEHRIWRCYDKCPSRYYTRCPAHHGIDLTHVHLDVYDDGRDVIYYRSHCSYRGDDMYSQVVLRDQERHGNKGGTHA